jgi:putative oxidoreductase
MFRYPFITLRQALWVLRIVTPLLFMAHAAVRIVNGTIPQFGAFMESVGFPNGVLVVWGITITELVAGALMIAGYGVRWMAAPLFAIAAGGVFLIHRHLGWFVGEHGTGGSEYSVALMVMLIVIAAADDGAANAPDKNA